MIIKNEEQIKLEFGNGDISIAGGYTTGDTVKGFVVFENQEAREVGSPGITKKGEIDYNDHLLSVIDDENDTLYHCPLCKK